MARKTKTLQIDDREVEVRELTVRQIIDLVESDKLFSTGEDSKEGLLGSLSDTLDAHLLKLCTNIKTEDFLEMAPSDIKEIWNAFREVNATFFDVARQAGLLEAIENIKEEIVKTIKEDFLKLPAGLLKQDTSESSTTDIPT